MINKMGGQIKILDAKKGEKPIPVVEPPKEEWKDQHTKKILKIANASDLMSDGTQQGVFFEEKFPK